MNIKHLLSCAACLVGASSLPATSYEFSNYDTVVLDAGSSPFTGTLHVELGLFTPGFTPTAANTASWVDNWHAGSAGYFDASGPEWSVSLNLIDNLVYSEGRALGLWVYDQKTGDSRQWAFLSSPSWRVELNTLLDPSIYAFDFGADTLALLGAYNPGEVTLAGAALAIPAAVPEPGTYALLGVGMLNGLILLRRRKGIQALRHRRTPPCGRATMPKA